VKAINLGKYIKYTVYGRNVDAIISTKKIMLKIFQRCEDKVDAKEEAQTGDSIGRNKLKGRNLKEEMTWTS